VDVTVTTDQLVDAFRKDWPVHYEATALRLALAEQSRRAEQLEARVAELEAREHCEATP
jgi:hypothetical protein